MLLIMFIMALLYSSDPVGNVCDCEIASSLTHSLTTPFTLSSLFCFIHLSTLTGIKRQIVVSQQMHHNEARNEEQRDANLIPFLGKRQEVDRLDQ